MPLMGVTYFETVSLIKAYNSQTGDRIFNSKDNLSKNDFEKLEKLVCQNSNFTYREDELFDKST